MKRITKNIVLSLGVIFGLALAANAQAIPSGTVDFSVAVPNAFDIRGNGTPTVTSGITTSGGTANNALGVTLTVIDASPNINNAALTANVPIRLRSNAAYQLTGIYNPTGGNPISITPSNADLDASDIGMSITYNPRSGARVNTGGTDTVVTGWQTGGGKTAADLDQFGVQISTGARISNQGTNLSTDNFETANLNFTIARQYYTPTIGASGQVTITISAP